MKRSFPQGFSFNEMLIHQEKFLVAQTLIRGAYKVGGEKKIEDALVNLLVEKKM